MTPSPAEGRMEASPNEPTASATIAAAPPTGVTYPHPSTVTDIASTSTQVPLPSGSVASATITATVGVRWVPLSVALPQDSPDGAGAPRTSQDQFQETVDDIPPPKVDFSAPPPYEEVTKLPTYEEVQREKTMQGEVPWPNVSIPRAPPHPHPHPHPQPLTFLAIDAESGPEDGDSAMLGTDFMFFTAFVVAFVFNWVGFLLLMCFCHTIAARYGALSGFGLSLAKWTLIVKHSKVLESRENNWLWWLIMTFGLLICVRAIIQYLNIKRGWRMLSGSAQERLMFFY